MQDIHGRRSIRSDELPLHNLPTIPATQPEGSDQENEVDDEIIPTETEAHFEYQESDYEKQEACKSTISKSMSLEPGKKKQNALDSVNNEQASSKKSRHNNCRERVLASKKQEVQRRESLSPEPIRGKLKASSSVTKEQSEMQTLIYSTNTTPRKLPFRIIIPVALVIICLYLVKTRTSSLPVTLNCSFKEIQGQYPKENESLWKNLKVGIELILNKKNKNKPAVYLFAHHGGQTAFQLVNDTAVHCSKCFGKELVPMGRDDFISAPGSLDDYGYAIEKYRNKLEKGNVILVANLNEIPANAARAFHTICDTHNPISDSAVIFLTITVSANKLGNANSMAEETLRDIWGSELRSNELEPLITRVTDQVIILRS